MDFDQATQTAQAKFGLWKADQLVPDGLQAGLIAWLVRPGCQSQSVLVDQPLEISSSKAFGQAGQ